MPVNVATTPHIKVKVGSQNLGVVRLRMMLQGIYRCRLVNGKLRPGTFQLTSNNTYPTK